MQGMMYDVSQLYTALQFNIVAIACNSTYSSKGRDRKAARAAAQYHIEA
jgi:hypothetical protein